jgi:hypothetical protein
MAAGRVKKQPGPLKWGVKWQRPSHGSTDRFRFCMETSPDVRRKILEHEAEDGWTYVTNVAIGDDENLVFKKSG